MARLVLVKIGVDVVQFDEAAFNVYVYAEKSGSGEPCQSRRELPASISRPAYGCRWSVIVRATADSERKTGQWQQLVHAIVLKRIDYPLDEQPALLQEYQSCFHTLWL